MALNPVGYWPLTETNQPGAAAANAPDLGSGAENGTISGIVTPISGALAGDSDVADLFDNSRIYQTTVSPTGSPTAPFTIEAWINSHAPAGGTQCALSDVDPNSPRSGWLLYIDIDNPGQYTFRTYTGVGTGAGVSMDIGAASSIPRDSWHHLAVVFVQLSASPETNAAYGYLDGVLVSAFTNTAHFQKNDGLTAGLSMGARGDTGGAFFFNGAIDEVAYYTTALSAATIQSHYQAGTNPAPVTAYSQLVSNLNPIAYFRMDEETPLPVAKNYGSAGAGATGYYQTGTLPGQAAGPDFAGLGGTSTNNVACDFPGNNVSPAGIIAGLTPSLSGIDASHSVSVLAWVQLPGLTLGGFTGILGRGDNSYRFAVDTSFDPHWDNNQANPDLVGGSGLGDGNWHLWAAVYDQSTSNAQFYIDSQLVSSGTGFSAEVAANATQPLLIGGAPDYTTRYLMAEDPGANICQVAIFTNALTATQLYDLYYNNVTADTAPSITMPATFGVNAGQNVTLSASATGTGPLAYHWYYLDASLNSNNIVSGSTPDALLTTSQTITNAQPSQNNWTYYLTVSNAYGVVTSNAVLTVFTAPVISSEPTVASVYFSGIQTVNLHVGASGAVPLYYIWFSNNVARAVFTNNGTYSFTAPPSGSYNYFAIVSNFLGTATSTVVTVTSVQPGTFQTAILAASPLSYWPLDESSGTTATDYVGTNNGTYEGGYTLAQTGPTEGGFGGAPNYSVHFDGTSADVRIPVGNLNLTTPMTMMAWVFAAPRDGNFHTFFGHSDSSYRLDFDGSGDAHFNDGANGEPSSPAAIDDGFWHHVAGVYDGTNDLLYVDGVMVASRAATTAVAGSTDDVLIGGDPQYAPGRDFDGYIAHAAIFGKALSAAQISNIVAQADALPLVTLPATNNASEGANATWTATIVHGSGPFVYQWYQVSGGVTNSIGGATNASFTLTNVTLAENGNVYVVNVGNAYGSTYSGQSVLNVIAGPAILLTDIYPPLGQTYAGQTVTYTVLGAGATPLYYQWLLNGATIGGATNPSYTFAAVSGSNSYSCIVSNSLGATNSSTAALLAALPPQLVDFSDTSLWQEQNVNVTTTPFSGGVLTLTDGAGSEARSVFYDIAQDITAFTAEFVYTDVGGGGADGATFCIQNDPRRATALGAAGGSFAYGSPGAIVNSVAFEMNLYSGNGGSSLGVGLNGSIAYTPTTTVLLTSGDPIQVKISYYSGVAEVVLYDTLSGTFESHFFTINIPAVVGDQFGYMGLTGATGGVASQQTVANFAFSVSTIPKLTARVSGSNVLVTWPGGVSTKYALQRSTNVRGPWVGVASSLVGGVNQHSEPNTADAFFRLALQ